MTFDPSSQPSSGGEPPYGQQPAQYGQRQPYGQQPSPYGQRGTNTMAVLALVFAFVFWPLGIVFGFIARSQIKRTGEGGNGLALAGIIIGFVALAFIVVLIIVAASVGFGTRNTSTYNGLAALVR